MYPGNFLLTEPDILMETDGIKPMIINTIYTVVLTLLFCYVVVLSFSYVLLRLKNDFHTRVTAPRKAKRCLSQRTISDPSRHFAIIRSWSKAPSWQAGRQTPLLQPRTWSWLLAAYCAMSHLTARKKALLLTMNALLWHIDRQRCRGKKDERATGTLQL